MREVKVPTDGPVCTGCHFLIEPKSVWAIPNILGCFWAASTEPLYFDCFNPFAVWIEALSQDDRK